ncbi:MAG: SRPBCC family protein [Streptosporangiaceae bacterium]
MGKAIVTETANFEVAPAAVWAVLGDLRRLPEWLASHDSFPKEPPAAVPGATFAQRVKGLGRSAEVDWRVETVEAPRSLVLSGRGPMNVKVWFSLSVEPAEAGSTVTYRTEYTSLLLSGPLVTQVHEAATPVMRESLRNLAALFSRT